MGNRSLIKVKSIPFPQVLQVDDVILAIEGQKVANDGEEGDDDDHDGDGDDDGWGGSGHGGGHHHLSFPS